MEQENNQIDLFSYQKQDQLYLSFEIIENEIMSEQASMNVRNRRCQLITQIIGFLFTTLRVLILFGIVWIIKLPLFIYEGLDALFKKHWSQALLVFWYTISIESINYTVYNFIFFREKILFAVEQILKDTLFFMITCLLVVIYLKIKTDDTISYSLCVLSDPKLEGTLFFLYLLEDYEFGNYLIDYKFKKLESQCLPNPNKYFNFFEDQEVKQIDSFMEGFDEILPLNILQIFILISVVILKLFMVFYYLYIHSQMNISTNDVIDLTISIFVYLYITIVLCTILGNSDLIRKINQLNKLQNYIDFSGQDIFKNNKLTKKRLDILSPNSLQCWDSFRKLLMMHEQDNLVTLKLAYLGLFFYFVFVVLIFLSAFYELYWIIPKDSALLSDVIVIMSLFNFIFLSLFFIFRFQKGTQFNQSFEDLLLTVQELIYVFSDLNIQYNDYFMQKNESSFKVQKDSIYGLMIIKIKQMSQDFIGKKQEYQGKQYTLEEKQVLRKEIIINTKRCLKKVLHSIQADQQQYSYKFLNIIEIKFNEFITTILLITTSSLPQIIPKLIGFYQK
ncbi:hypothetical protein ABPG74_006687 [Tetrahymena malaccensis]